MSHYKINVPAFYQHLAEVGLLTVLTRDNILRIAPPLIMKPREIDYAQHILEHTLAAPTRPIAS